LGGAVTDGIKNISPIRRDDILMAMLAEDDLTLAAYVLRRFSDRESRTFIMDGFLPPHSDVEDYTKRRLHEEAEADGILSASYPAHILFLWSDLMGDGPVREHIDAAVDAKIHFAAIAETVLSAVHSSDEGVFYRFTDRISIYLDIDTFSNWAADVVSSGVESDAVWAERFLDARRRSQSRDGF
jgi:hypothetical protein